MHPVESAHSGAKSKAVGPGQCVPVPSGPRVRGAASPLSSCPKHSPTRATEDPVPTAWGKETGEGIFMLFLHICDHKCGHPCENSFP